MIYEPNYWNTELYMYYPPDLAGQGSRGVIHTFCQYFSLANTTVQYIALAATIQRVVDSNVFKSHPKQNDA